MSNKSAHRNQFFGGKPTDPFCTNLFKNSPTANQAVPSSLRFVFSTNLTRYPKKKKPPNLIMRSFASLNRNRPSLHQLALIQRFQLRQSSSLPLINAASNSNRDTSSNQENLLWGSFLKWASGITVGSGLGLLYWSHDKPLLSFADFASAESTVDDASSSSVSAFIPKLALPQTPKNLFGGINTIKCYFESQGMFVCQF